MSSYDWIIYSGGPYFYFSLGPFFAKKYAINYILDFRDLWVYESRNPRKILSKMYIKLLRKFHYIKEKEAVKYAQFVITVSPSDKNRMLNAYVKYQSKFYVIYNGYDDKKLIDFKVIPRNGNFNNPVNLMVFGKFMYYGEEASLVFFSTIENLYKNGKLVKIVHIGNREEEVDKMLMKFDLPFDLYECTGVCDYKKGMEILQSADIFISIYPVRSGLGTKIFDYIFHNKPVVLFGYKSSEIAIYFSQFENFYACETISEGSSIMTNIINKEFQILDSNIQPYVYSRTHQWDKFIALLEY
jgi:glycosyltransferase involved in cell wall biosynthesis